MGPFFLGGHSVNGDWIKIHRKIVESAVFEGDAAFRLWTYLLLAANWKERQLLDGTVLKPGQAVRGYRRIAKDLHWAKSKVERWLGRLQLLGNIKVTRRPGTQAQIVTICNWETYQGDGAPNGDTTGDTTGDKKKKERKKEGKNKGAAPVFDPLRIDFPRHLDTSGFRGAWAEWVQHRAEIKAKLTPTSVSRQMKEFSRMGERRAIAAIHHTILKGWRGIREDEDPRGVPVQPPPPPNKILGPIR